MGPKVVDLPSGDAVMLVSGDVCHPPDSKCRLVLNTGCVWFRFLHDSKWHKANHKSMFRCVNWLAVCNDRDEAFTALTEF